MSGEDHPLSDGSPVRLPLDYAIRNIALYLLYSTKQPVARQHTYTVTNHNIYSDNVEISVIDNGPCASHARYRRTAVVIKRCAGAPVKVSRTPTAGANAHVRRECNVP
ncbi:hypothetical protein EVAR_18554_1 [Eumeta japonica]|uniref:Uncharacterized protein n=1 Tax=Eumeta variegata TaxID=151549 RepID=A0A4C1V4A4_EUMVA|nr:hypothetical protein EVAR_18554_1 [Eumeta japonica]